VTAEHCRVEQYSGQKFSSICSRAYSSLEQMLTQTEHLIDKKGVWLAMKGVFPQAEVDGLSSRFQVKKTIPLVVPELVAERHLLIIKKKLIS
jgi:16S rRNA (guanine527-N7)-methyltransferase